MSVPPITEGMVVKGGQNQGPSQITERPMAPGAITPPPDGNVTGMTGDRYRHRNGGGIYRVLFEAAKAQSSTIALENMTMVVYQGENDGRVWVRPALEFFDGRFERLG